MLKFSSAALDRIAMSVAAACGLHCVCFPILLAISTASSFVHLLSRPAEVGFIVTSFILGVANLSFSWRKRHHRPECLVLFAIGMAFILAHDSFPGVVVSATVSVLGGTLIGAAHLHNLRLVRRCDCCPSLPRPCARSGES
jgi:hypothetical protein